MKKAFLTTISFAALTFSIANCDNSGSSTASSTSKPTNLNDSVSYVMGTDLAKSVKGFNSDINLDLLFRGISDRINDKSLLIPDSLTGKIIRDFSKIKSEGMKTKNLEAGKKFLAENAKKEGIKVTSSGLQYKIEKQGKGENAKATDKVKVNYKGMTLDGKVFDSSYKRGKPAEFAANRVIKGWTEGLQLMNPGSKFTFYIPSDLAYGTSGAGRDIEPNSTLIFEIELLEILAPAEKK